MPDHRLKVQNQRSTAAAEFAPPGSCLAPCVYVALLCPRCGEVRQSLAERPSSTAISCPQCGTACDFLVLGTGFTRRPLPSFAVRRSDSRLLARRDELPSAEPPQLNLSG